GGPVRAPRRARAARGTPADGLRRARAHRLRRARPDGPPLHDLGAAARPAHRLRPLAREAPRARRGRRGARADRRAPLPRLLQPPPGRPGDGRPPAAAGVRAHRGGRVVIRRGHGAVLAAQLKSGRLGWVAAAARRTLALELGFARGPLFGTLAVTWRCNYRCTFCDLPERARG